MEKYEIEKVRGGDRCHLLYILFIEPIQSMMVSPIKTKEAFFQFFILQSSMLSIPYQRLALSFVYREKGVKFSDESVEPTIEPTQYRRALKSLTDWFFDKELPFFQEGEVFIPTKESLEETKKRLKEILGDNYESIDLTGFEAEALKK